MPFNKPHIEFLKIDEQDGWQSPPGYPPTAKVYEKILASDIDEQAKTGSRTRLLKFEPGQFSTKAFVHDHWEEVYVVSGDLIVGNDENGEGGERFTAPTYACRPPGIWHGPFKSETGALLFEMHYYDESKAD
ncbi:MAG: cupin [Pseudomonadota bacterium]